MRGICTVVVLDLEMVSFNYTTKKRDIQLCYITSPLMISSDDSDNERMIYSFVTVEYQLKRLLSLVNAEHWKYLSPHLQKGRKIVWYKTLRKIFRKQRKKINCNFSKPTGQERVQHSLHFGSRSSKNYLKDPLDVSRSKFTLLRAQQRNKQRQCGP